MSGSRAACPRKVLVTGAGGFIGSHLAADQARRGNSVVAVDLRIDRVRHLESPRFECVQADVALPAVQARVLEGVDTVFHLAAAHLGVDSRAEYERVNVEAVRGLVEASRRAEVRRFVHCSSVGVFGRIEKPPASEDSPCYPDIPYETSKLEGEQVVLQAVRSNKGFPATVLRPAWVYGPGCPRTEKLFRAVGAGRFLLAGKGTALRHCVYIRDMIDAFNLAAECPEAIGQVIIVGDDCPVEVRELIARIAALTGARTPRSVPLVALYAAGLTAEFLFRALRREPPLSRRSLKFFTGNTSFQIDRAKALLGYRPKFDLASGLAETHELLQCGAYWRVPIPDRRVS